MHLEAGVQILHGSTSWLLHTRISRNGADVTPTLQAVAAEGAARPSRASAPEEVPQAAAVSESRQDKEAAGTFDARLSAAKVCRSIGFDGVVSVDLKELASSSNAGVLRRDTHSTRVAGTANTISTLSGMTHLEAPHTGLTLGFLVGSCKNRP